MAGRAPLSAIEGARPETPVQPGSDRGFGIVFAVAFAAIALWPLTGEGGMVRWWAAGIAAAFLLIALVAPKALHRLNLLWARFAMALHRVISPVVMGLLFFAVAVPTGLLMRLLRKDLLRLRKDPNAHSYWILRRPVGPSPESMRNQF